MTKTEPNINEKVRDAIASVMTPMDHPIIHGVFNRRMVLEAFVTVAGAGVSIEADDIQKYAGITDRELKVILKEYMKDGIIVKESSLFGAKLYKLNLTT